MEDFLHAIHEVQPAFGASTDDLVRCRLNTSDFYSNQSRSWFCHFPLCFFFRSLASSFFLSLLIQKGNQKYCIHLIELLNNRYVN
ncbi:hypothetical protein YC2023_101897 [Brassica napus]